MTNSKTITIKKLLTLFSLFLSVLFTSCKQSNTVSELGKNIRSILQDRNGNYWFGSESEGVYRYDGKSLTNFTEENRINNYEYDKHLNNSVKSGNLARVWTINEDNNEDLWIGTIDLGAWRYDGKNLTHYTTKEGLTSNAINTIYKDKNGELWFGTATDVCKFNPGIHQ